MIRPALATDAEALAVVHAAAFGEAQWTAKEIAQSLAMPTTKAWAIEETGALRGFIMCQVTHGEAEILTFCIAPAHRRKGLGWQLIDMLLSAAKQQSVHRIFLEVAEDNDDAIALYQKAGFKIIGKRKNYYARGGTAIDALLMDYT